MEIFPALAKLKKIVNASMMGHVEFTEWGLHGGGFIRVQEIREKTLVMSSRHWRSHGPVHGQEEAPPQKSG